MNQRKRVAAEAAVAAEGATTYLFLSVMPSVFGLPGTTGFIMRL
jgi:hypothetical protein